MMNFDSPRIIQEKRILRLCKRLDKFSFEDILTIADDVEESVLELLLLTLVNEKRLILKNDTYFYNKNKINNQNLYSQGLKLPSFFQYHTKEETNLIIKCFCAEIPAEKVYQICDTGKNAVFNLYNYIRKILFKTQLEQLNKLYDKKPKRVRYRALFNQRVYMYIYDKKVFVTDKVLHHKEEEIQSTKSETKEFKKICCYLSRIECHNKNEVNLYYKIAEALWRRNKSFEELFNDLKANLLNIS